MLFECLKHRNYFPRTQNATSKTKNFTCIQNKRNLKISKTLFDMEKQRHYDRHHYLNMMAHTILSKGITKT